MDPTGYDRKRSNLIFFSSHGVCRVVPFDVRRIRRKKIKDKERGKKEWAINTSRNIASGKLRSERNSKYAPHIDNAHDERKERKAVEVRFTCGQ